jgi:hypothetical protein
MLALCELEMCFSPEASLGRVVTASPARDWPRASRELGPSLGAGLGRVVTVSPFGVGLG